MRGDLGHVHEGRASYVGQSFENTFLAEAAQVLAATTRSIRLCARADCSRVFIARRRGKFCNEKCSWIVRSRREYDQAEIKRLGLRGHSCGPVCMLLGLSRNAKPHTQVEARRIVDEMRRQRTNARLNREAGVRSRRPAGAAHRSRDRPGEEQQDRGKLSDH